MVSDLYISIESLPDKNVEEIADIWNKKRINV